MTMTHCVIVWTHRAAAAVVCKMLTLEPALEPYSCNLPPRLPELLSTTPNYLEDLASICGIAPGAPIALVERRSRLRPVARTAEGQAAPVEDGAGRRPPQPPSQKTASAPRLLPLAASRGGDGVAVPRRIRAAPLRTGRVGQPRVLMLADAVLLGRGFPARSSPTGRDPPRVSGDGCGETRGLSSEPARGGKGAARSGRVATRCSLSLVYSPRCRSTRACSYR